MDFIGGGGGGSFLSERGGRIFIGDNFLGEKFLGVNFCSDPMKFIEIKCFCKLFKQTNRKKKKSLNKYLRCFTLMLNPINVVLFGVLKKRVGRGYKSVPFNILLLKQSI